RLIDLAMLAPSSSNLQPWEFHWVRSPQLKQELITACLSQPAAKTAGELLVVVARKATWRRNTKEMLRRFENLSDSVPNAVLQYYKGIVPKAMATGPLGLMAAIKWIFTRVVRYRQPMPQEPIGSNDVRVWAHKSVALAAQTFMLACRAHNLDSCPMEGFDSWRVRKILRLPKDAEISMIIGLGTAKPEGIYGDRLRFDRSWFVFEH
ncbi:MAG: nitroreductase family protein, partial [Proteobacteria bacterium]|nr:nitroreductase family protein [Pseudomonadota bacterium]